MSPPRLHSTPSLANLSIISLSTFDTNDNHYDHNTNNNRDYLTEKPAPVYSKSLTQTLDQAVKYFEHILNQCTATSNTSLIRKNDSKFDLRKRDRDDGLRSINRKRNFKRKPKINCRRWCEEQNRQITKSNYSTRTFCSRNLRSSGSIFFCRKSLLQNPDGTTYICIRKRGN